MRFMDGAVGVDVGLVGCVAGLLGFEHAVKGRRGALCDEDSGAQLTFVGNDD